MPRTYLPSTGAGAGAGKSKTNVKGNCLTWRPSVNVDSSDEEEPIRLVSLSQAFLQLHIYTYISDRTMIL